MAMNRSIIPSPLDTTTAKKLANQIRDWANSQEGTSKLIAAKEEVQNLVEAAEKASHVSPELLRKPITL